MNIRKCAYTTYFWLYFYFRFKLIFTFTFIYIYGDYVAFVHPSYPWSLHSGPWWDEVLAGSFYFNHTYGDANNNNGSRLVEATIICVSLYYYFFVIHEYYRSLIPILEKR